MSAVTKSSISQTQAPLQREHPLVRMLRVVSHESAFQRFLPMLGSLPSLPPVKIARKKIQGKTFLEVVYRGGKRRAVVNLEHTDVTYMLAFQAPAHNLLVTTPAGKTFILHRADSKEHLESVVAASDALSEFSVTPEGYVVDASGARFCISHATGFRRVSEAQMTPDQKLSAARSMISLQADLISKGLSCGGITLDNALVSRGKILLANPLSITVSDPDNASESVTEGAVTVSHCSRLAGKRRLSQFAASYHNRHPATRSDARRHAISKGRKPEAALQLFLSKADLSWHLFRN